MNAFLQTALSFPTLPWSVLFTVAVLYWLVAALGVFDLDAGMEGDSPLADAGGILTRLGLRGIPLMLIVLVLSFFAWISVYFFQLYILDPLFSGTLRTLVGTAAMLLAAIPGILMASLLLRPVRRFMLKLTPASPPSLLGKVGTVTTPEVDDQHGMASFEDGGAGLLLQVRAHPPDVYPRGERVVLLEYREADNSWRVISEKQFNR
ncbi:hypothetical protein CO614_00095 [Lysobacteraceae bacterium NML120232]|nr:hypothetical protein CO608_01910 [Xanthomonadaceae bacterium NML08-0793]PJK13715.1 hypothetical protein CO614_00095 [Xanthomonadaceae bacterium NML120232]